MNKFNDMYSVEEELEESLKREKILEEQLKMLVKDDEINQETIIDLQQKIDKVIEKLESIRIFGLRSGKTLLSTLINESIDILRGDDNESNKES